MRHRELSGSRCLNQEEVGKMLGLTKSRVSQIERAALARLARAVRRDRQLMQLARDLGVLPEEEGEHES